MPALSAKSVTPNVRGLRDWIVDRRPQPRVHVVELFQDVSILQAIATRYGLWQGLNLGLPTDALKAQVQIQGFLGYDMIRVQSPLPMTFRHAAVEDTVAKASGQSKGQRTWTDEHTGPITSWETFQQLPWPR